MVTSQLLRKLCSTWLLYAFSISMVTVQAGPAGAWEAFTRLGAYATASFTPLNQVWGRQVEPEEDLEMGKVL